MQQRIICLKECIHTIQQKRFRKVLVSGPQRSGTHIATKIIADELKFTPYGEIIYGIHDFIKFQEEFRGQYNIVVTGPAIAHKLHKLPPVWFVVFMYREIFDITNSQQRIKWNGESFERTSYINEFKLSGDILDHPISVIKYRVFEERQLPILKHRCVKLSYPSLAIHRFFIPKKDRPKLLYK